MAKPALILFLAFFLETRTKSMDDWRNTLLPAVVPTLVFIGLIVFQPDLGTAIACAAITGCVLFVAGLDMRYLGYAFAASLLPLYFLIFHVAYRRDRILAFLESILRSSGPRLSHHSIADRGQHRRNHGRGLDGREAETFLSCPSRTLTSSSRSRPKNWAWWDALVIVALFAIFLWRGIRTALRTEDMFGRFLAVGITSMVVVQAFINISVVLGLMPTKASRCRWFPTAVS